MFAELIQNGHTVNAQMLAGSCEGPAHAIEPDCVIHLLGRQATATHRHVMATQDLADRPPLDPEPLPQLVHRRPTLIPGDQLPNLTIIETTNPPTRTDRLDPKFGTVGHRTVRID
ncbi:hypothetical protein [Nocardia wallacei]|uniref:hypothetical protein n=1 Tax=Nocardia wallacei TaxID=480035 RepID=UPI002454A045|nr:hypothetical protein [Nocardia wallacei]